MDRKYKLIAVDIDGTLLNNKKELTLNNKRTIEEAMDAGAIFAISTGRAYITAKKYFEVFNRNIPLILYNGGLVCMSETKEVIFSALLPNDLCYKIIDIIEENNGTFCFWCGDDVYFNHLDSHAEYYHQVTGINPKLYDRSNHVIDNVIKFIWFDSVEKLQFAQEKVLNNVDGINYFKSQKTFLEIVPSQISKATALSKLAERYNIKQEDVIAIGDGENDLPMLKWAGLGVAMENANDIVKNGSDVITSSNEEDGVAEAIKKYVL